MMDSWRAARTAVHFAVILAALGGGLFASAPARAAGSGESAVIIDTDRSIVSVACWSPC